MKVRIAVLAVLALAAVSVAVTATAAPKMQKPKANIVGVAAADARFSTLVSLVKQAGLVKTLSGKGPFTVFAPTNKAFAALQKNDPDTFKAVTTDKALLTKVLTYHVVAKRIPSTAAVSAAKKNGSVTTVQGEPITLSLKGGKLFLNGTAQVVIPDVKATNGVIHAINAVLVPPSISAAG